MIKLNLQEISDFVGSVGVRLETFEVRLGDLENKIDSNIKSPPKDIILPVLALFFGCGALPSKSL